MGDSIYEKLFNRAIGVLLLILLFVVVVFVSAMLLSIVRYGFVDSFEVHQKIVQECIASDLYTRDECITLAGRGGD